MMRVALILVVFASYIFISEAFQDDGNRIDRDVEKGYFLFYL